MTPGREPTRDAIDQLPGAVVLEFGARWCGHCQALAPHLVGQLERFPHIRHIRIEDAKGRRLGRSFGVKLWPTLVFMHNGKIIGTAVRPEPDEFAGDFEQLASLVERRRG
jgi:thioredoxin 1